MSTVRESLLAMGLTWCVAGLALGQGDKPDFPDFKEVSKDYEKVVTTADGRSFYTLWTRDRDAQMLAELPRGWQGQEHFFAMTVAEGETFAGLQGADMLVKWVQYDKRLALVQPNLDVRTTGDKESQDAVDQIYTDRVILDVPIVCMGPNGQPVIDMDDLLVGRASTFFGDSVAGANTRLVKIHKAKAFEENNEIAFTLPVGGGQIKTIHYSLSLLKGTPGFKPRVADSRVGFFTTTYRDLGKVSSEEIPVRYINRWHLEKRDPKLRLSPPKEPLVFYVDHTVPVRYRRWVREGLEYWNRAFEQVGIINAIEVRQQDASTGAYMDIDPENVKYNFIRWVTNEVGLAIGPSRVNPRTGEILDADVVVSDGWVRAWEYEFSDIAPQLAMEGFSPETMAWLDQRPQWDPRIRLAPPAERDYLLAERARRGILPYGGHPVALGDPKYRSDEAVVSRLDLPAGICNAAFGKAFDVALARMAIDAGLMAVDEEEGDTIDGMPEKFIGPLLADLIAHEVGHTLGLRHNFKASALYDLDEINSDKIRGKQPLAASVMDYLPTNFNMDEEAVQGDYAMIGIGPYDMWAIEYGYTMDEQALPGILKRCVEPELQYATDEDTGGSDPLARRYDFAKDPLDYAKSQMALASYHRERLLDKFVKDGEPWSRARRGYQITLSIQTRAVNMMAGWIGGAHTVRDKKGDPGNREPVVPVDPETQRTALRFVIENAFRDEAFGLTPEMLKYLTVEKWWDDNSAAQDPAFPVHDRIMGIQASVLTMLMNPSTLGRVYDNEFRVPADQDAFTLPELFEALRQEIWSEIQLSSPPMKNYTVRQPMVSSLRRNLQREHIDRLIDLTGPNALIGAASKPVTNLALADLRAIKKQIDHVLERGEGKIDPYTSAHLTEASLRIEQVLDAQYVYNQDAGGGFGLPSFFNVAPGR